MLKFIDIYNGNDEVILDTRDVKLIRTDADGNILIENTDGLFFATDKIIFV